MAKKDLKEFFKKLLVKADIEINGSRPWDIQIHNEGLYGRVMKHGSLGLGEAYMDGWWDAKKLDEFFDRILRAGLEKEIKDFDLLWLWVKSAIFNRQNLKKAVEVADVHYNLGNDFYELMLDKRMIYSCAYWKDAKNLDEAQENKLDLICRKLQLKKGERLLDIGSGWGGLAKYAAEKYGVSVVGINISKEQIAYSRENCKGLPVEILEVDYRKFEAGEFDKIVSVGMFEHVGYRNYRSYMEAAFKSLKQGGLFLLHSFGSEHTSKISEPWVDKYIFPNGMVPSIAQVGEAVDGLFVMEDWHNFGSYYDPTLVAWYENFDKHWHKIKGREGFDERFYRMWKYYLLSLAGAFRSRQTQLWQIVLSKKGSAHYESVR
jgi:cyclopropane-fatty-acyl-phospholipid synthase